MTGEAIRTSVIVPAYRAWSTLPAVLDALALQLTDAHEVLLVHSGGGDDPAEGSSLGPRLAQRWPWLGLVEVKQRLSPGAARNRGAARARGSRLIFLDADSVPSSGWLESLEQALSDDVEAVCGTIRNGTPDDRIGSAEYLLTCSEAFLRRPRRIRHAPGANLLVRRRYFEAVGGFREDLRTGEDTVLTFALAERGRLAFAGAAAVHHLNRTQLVPFLDNQRLQGAGFVAIGRLVAYPNGWICRWPAILVAGPLRLLALGRCIAWNPSEARTALRALPLLLLGTAAWTVGALQERAGAAAALDDQSSAAHSDPIQTQPT